VIYFLQSPYGRDNLVKIGVAEDLADAEWQRVRREARTGGPLTLLATAEGGPAELEALCARFDHLRRRFPAEVVAHFRPGPDLMASIKGLRPTVPRGPRRKPDRPRLGGGLTVAEAAAALECSIGTVYHLVRAGRLAHRRVGPGRGEIRVERAALDAYRASTWRPAAR
jgi:excisionase family DNA binding protein